MLAFNGATCCFYRFHSTTLIDNFCDCTIFQYCDACVQKEIFKELYSHSKYFSKYLLFYLHIALLESMSSRFDTDHLPHLLESIILQTDHQHVTVDIDLEFLLVKPSDTQYHAT